MTETDAMWLIHQHGPLSWNGMLRFAGGNASGLRTSLTKNTGRATLELVRGVYELTAAGVRHFDEIDALIAARDAERLTDVERDAVGPPRNYKLHQRLHCPACNFEASGRYCDEHWHEMRNEP